MARERVYKVVIDGEEYVSKAAKQAGDGMDDFAKKQPRWIKSFADLKLAWDAITGAVQQVWGAIQGSFDAFDAYEASLRKMEAQSKLTGVPMQELTALAAEGRREFGLGRVVANDYATVVGIYATVAGNAALKSQLFAASLELGAANGLDAAATMEALEQGLRGQDEGFDRLLKKNPSSIWQEYAAANGLAVGKMTDTQKRLAEVTALIESGTKVGGNYATMLETSAGKQAQLNNRMENAKIAVGEALQPLRVLAIEGMTQLAGGTEGASGSLGMLASSLASILRVVTPVIGIVVKLADVLVSSLAVGLQFVVLDVQRFALVWTQRFGQVAASLGTFVAKAGDMLKVFGVQVVANTGDAIKQWGETQRDTASAALDQLAVKIDRFKEDTRRTADRLFGNVRQAADREVPPTVARVASLGTAMEEATQRSGDAIKRNLGPATRDLVKLTELAMVDLKATATETLSPKKADDFRGAMDVLTRKLHEARDATASMAPKVDQNIDKTRDLTREVGTVARGALDLAQSFGVVDAQAASLLNSVVNIASALPRALAGDITSIGGIIGGVANIAQQITQGDQARRKLLADNTRSLDRLSKEVSGLRLNVTGEQFAKVQDVLARVVPNLKMGGLQNFAGDMSTLATALRGSGLTMADLEAVAKELGIGLRDGSGNFRREALGQLLQAMGLVTPTTMGNSFADQRALMEDRFGVQGTSAAQQLADLFGLGTRFGVGALGRAFDPNDLQGTRASLGALFEQFAAGGLSASDLGGLTSSEFRDLLLDLIKRTDDLIGAPTSPAPAPVAGGETLPPVGSAPTPASTLADVFRDYASETLPLFSQQIALQTRIADATEATAANTARTAEGVIALTEAITSEAFINALDRGLGDRRRDAEINNGQGIRL